MPITRHHLDLPHGAVSYLERGRGDAVVLLHGVPGSARVWEPVLDRLGDRVRAVAPDLMGFGDSGDASGAGLLAEAQAAAVVDLVEALGLGPVTLATHDFGGPVALEVVRARPDLVSGVLLSATNAFGDTPIPFPLSTIFWPVVGGLAAAALFSAPSLRLMLRTGCGRPHVALDADAYVGDARQAASIRSLFETSLRNLHELYDPLTEVLRDLTVPTAVVWGDRDPFFPVAQGRRTAGAVPGADLTILPGAGHFLPGERPDAFAAEVRRLVERARTERSPDLRLRPLSGGRGGSG